MIPKIIKGNIFNSNCQTLVNTVNCVGFMGKGIALEFGYRYPEMERKYKEMCKENKIRIGKLWLYKSNDKRILNFPTKKDWKHPSKLEYIEEGLKNFANNYANQGVTSIAFPQLGTSSGGLEWTEIRALMLRYLSNLEIPIEIYEFEAKAKDDLYEEFKVRVKGVSADGLKVRLKLKGKQADLVLDALNLTEVTSFAIMRNIKGLGRKTIEKIYSFALDENVDKCQYPSLFDHI